MNGPMMARLTKEGLSRYSPRLALHRLIQNLRRLRRGIVRTHRRRILRRMQTMLLIDVFQFPSYRVSRLVAVNPALSCGENQRFRLLQGLFLQDPVLKNGPRPCLPSLPVQVTMIGPMWSR